VVESIVEKLQRDEIEVICASVDGKHLHILARFPDHNPRHWVGRAKKHASHLLRQEGLRTEEGGLWAKRSHPEPIRDRSHQVSIFGYILRHKTKSDATWRV
jgi:REP element-mobilizing transposase RayT